LRRAAMHKTRARIARQLRNGRIAIAKTLSYQNNNSAMHLQTRRKQSLVANQKSLALVKETR
jgi:hypothetical protein